jgi:hypothetical protein
MSRTVEYYGRMLSLEPACGMTFARGALTDGRAVTLVYEPGDNSRYMLTVAPVASYGRTAWLVARGDGGYALVGPQVGAVVIGDASCITEQTVWPLCNGNEHTARVLSSVLLALLEPWAQRT